MRKSSPTIWSARAILYVRQSSAPSGSAQSGEQHLAITRCCERLMTFGWSDIDTVDDDLGRSAAGGVARAGFDRMVAEVCLGRVGAVAAREVSRFARNSRDWQQLIEMCRVVDTVLIDQDTVYAPRQGNDRLLLGLKGSLNEYELDLLRQRSLSARYEKDAAWRTRRGRSGRLREGLATDWKRIPTAVSRRPSPLCSTRWRNSAAPGRPCCGSLRQGLDLPARHNNGEVVWRRPNYATIHRMIENPIYGGAYAYGKTGVASEYGGDDGFAHVAAARRARNGWR